MLTGMIMQGLDQSLEIGFFLHIPFLPPGMKNIKESGKYKCKFR